MLLAFFHWVDIYTNGPKSEVGKTASVLAVASSSTSSHCILHHHTLAENKQASLI